MIGTDIPNIEAFNIWVVLIGALLPYLLKKFFPNLPIPSPTPTPNPVPTDLWSIVWLLLKQRFPNLPDLPQNGKPTPEHMAALVNCCGGEK